MKKIFFSLLAIGAIASCAKTEDFFVEENSEIKLAPVAALQTKANYLGAVDGTVYPVAENFDVYAYYKNVPAGQEFNDGKVFLTAGNSGVEFVNKGNYWGGAQNYYWPKNGSLRFAAYSPASVDMYHQQENDFYYVDDYVQPHETANTWDLLVAPTSPSYSLMTATEKVAVKFQHALSWITLKVMAKDADAAKVFDIKEVIINDVMTKADFGASMTDGIQYNEWKNQEVAEDYVVFTGSQMVTETAKDIETSKAGTLVIPQATTSVTVKFTQYGLNGTPTVDGMELTLDLVLDENAPWNPGKHYVYTLVFGLDKILINPSVADWEDVTANDREVGENNIYTAEELADALTADVENIKVVLQKDIDLPISSLGQITGGSGEYKLGGERTQNITIDLNGKKLNLTTDYMSKLGAKNANALFTIKNGKMTSSKAEGTWNIYDLTFANCDYEIENVEFLKAIAFDNANKSVALKNVTIKETHDYYAMWICAAGQNVTIDGLTVVSSGRGIAIKEEYLDAPACVTLNVENAKFATAKKAAVLVSSKAGAVINWGAGNDIKGVAADPINAVWVDEDYSQYNSEVKVEGASKVVEGAIDNMAANAANLSDVLEAAKQSETTVVVNLAEGTYAFPASKLSANVVLNCAEGTVFEGNSKANINGATVIGAKFSNPSGTVVDQTVNGTFKDCVFEGANALRWCYAGETVVFENCVFSGSTYGAHFDGGANDVLFKNCTFSGFNAFGAAITIVTFDGCKFVANGKSGYNGANLWGSTKMIDTEFVFDGNATYEWVDCRDAAKTYEFTGCTINNGNFLNETYVNAAGIIKVDGTEYDLNNSTFISTAEEFFAFANEVNVNNNAFNGKTVYLVADIDLDNAAWTPVGQTGATTFNGVFDGQNHTISNLNVNSEAQTGAHYSSGLFGWVESHTAGHGHLKNVKIAGATINGHHNCGALVGYITQETALVENCHVTGATVTCTKANNDADGDKAGALIGNATVATPVNNCTAANSTVSAGRDAGQVIGAGREANVTGCSATDVEVSANVTSTGANVRNEVIGRLL